MAGIGRAGIGELATGTFYLLLVALGLAGGGVAAWLNAGLEWQLLACGVVVLLGLVILRKTRVLKKRSTRPAIRQPGHRADRVGGSLVRQPHGPRLVSRRSLAG